MDLQPNCAICNAPAYPECPCESERLAIAVRQAEQRALNARLAEIREWVIQQARDYILSDFGTRSAARKASHASYLSNLPLYGVYAQHSGRPPLVPPGQLAQLQASIYEANRDLKRGIDSDWRAAVMRYPAVLDYYYSLVEVQTPSEKAVVLVQPSTPQPAHADGRRKSSRQSRARDGELEAMNGLTTLNSHSRRRSSNSTSSSTNHPKQLFPTAPQAPFHIPFFHSRPRPSHRRTSSGFPA